MPRPLTAAILALTLLLPTGAALARSGPDAATIHRPAPIEPVDLTADPDAAELTAAISTLAGLTLGGLLILAPAFDNNVEEELAGLGAALCGLSLTLGPSVGFFQADMWGRGGWGALGRASFLTFGLPMTAIGLFQSSFNNDSEDFLLLAIGLSLTSSALIWSFYDLANTDEEIRHNQARARRAFSLGLSPSTDGGLLTLTFTH